MDKMAPLSWVLARSMLGVCALRTVFGFVDALSVSFKFYMLYTKNRYWSCFLSFWTFGTVWSLFHCVDIALMSFESFIHCSFPLIVLRSARGLYMSVSCKPKVSMSSVVSNCVVLLERPTVILAWTHWCMYHHKLRPTIDDEQVLVCRVCIHFKTS